MRRAIITATLIVIVIYILTGFFGFATFVEHQNLASIMTSQNIFTAPYYNETYLVASMHMMIMAIVLATPLTVLPCKDTIEEIMLGQTRIMNGSENLICAIAIVSCCFLFAVAVPNIGDVMLVSGATCNPIVGFVLPVAYWLKVDKSSRFSCSRILAITVAATTCILSLISLSLWIKEKL
jgi:amino acid permease